MRSCDEWTVELGVGTATTVLAYEAETPSLDAALILAHGAGAGQRSPFMVAFASAIASHGIDTFTFNFPYTEQGRRVPDRRPVLEACYLAVIDAVRRRFASAARPLLIGGKSMGGRIATHVAAADAELRLAGLVLLGYPLHPPGKPDENRDAHLPAIRRPVLVVQGERDAFGTPAELDPALATMKPDPTLYVVPGGDHSFKVARVGRSGQQAVYVQVEHAVADWIAGVTAGR